MQNRFFSFALANFESENLTKMIEIEDFLVEIRTNVHKLNFRVDFAQKCSDTPISIYTKTFIKMNDFHEFCGRTLKKYKIV